MKILLTGAFTLLLFTATALADPYGCGEEKLPKLMKQAEKMVNVNQVKPMMFMEKKRIVALERANLIEAIKTCLMVKKGR